MKIAQEINTHRAMTIAGSVALLALTAYGVWKWNSSDIPPSVPGNKEDDKKKKSVTHSNDKVEKQSQEETVTEVEVEETETEEIIKVKEIKQTVESDRVILEQSESVVAIDKVELEQEIIEELKQVANELKDEEYVVVSKEEETATPAAVAPTTSTAEESHSCATSSTDDTDIWTPEHEIPSNNEVVDHKKNTPETKSTVTEEYIWKPDTTPTPTATATSSSEEKSSEEWAANATAVASAIVNETPVAAPVAAATPTHRPLSLSAPVFVPRKQVQQAQAQPKKNTKKRLSRAELIEQQRQNHTPHAKARCSHWPRCTNKNCKFWHPIRDCREGETCPFGNKCMFIHPSDYIEPPRVRKAHQQSSDEEDQTQQYIHNNTTQQQQQQQFKFTS